MAGVDVLIVSLGGTAGLREADAELAGSLRRAGARVEVAVARRPREWRTLPGIELAWALNARRAARAAIAAHAPRAALYSSTTASLLCPVPGAIRFDAPAAGNRPGRHGIWQRPVEARRFAAAPVLVPWSEGGLAEAPRPHADAVIVPVPVAPSGPPTDRDIAALTYGANPHKKGLDRVLAAWLREARPDEELVVTGLDERAGAAWLRAARPDEELAVTGLDERAGAARLGAGPGRVRFAGLVARAEHRALLRRARVFLTAPRREDYGIAQLEALADGCILVTTPSPGPYVGLSLARELDPRLVADELAIRTALDDVRPGYAERAAALLARWAPEAVDRVVAERLLPRLMQS